MTTKNEEEEVMEMLNKILNAIHDDSSTISDSPDKIFWCTWPSGLSPGEEQDFKNFNALKYIHETKIKDYHVKWLAEATEVFTDYKDFIKKYIHTLNNTSPIAAKKFKGAAQMALIMLVRMALRIYDLW